MHGKDAGRSGRRQCSQSKGMVGIVVRVGICGVVGSDLILILILMDGWMVSE